MILARLKEKALETALGQAARRVRATAPLVPRDDGLILFSMIGHRVVDPYLVAVKSLHAHLRRGRVALLDDGSLTAADRSLLVEQLGRPEIIPIGAVDVGDGPHGGCWERLMAVLDLARDAYVLQLDSDTLTLGDIPEVLAAIDGGRCFTLLGEREAEGHGVLTLPEFAAAYGHDGGALPPERAARVQNVIENRFHLYPDAASHRYVRGCAGFAGFARATVSRQDALRFSRTAETIVGHDCWHSWGSEQVASSFLIANTLSPVLLPYDRYSNYWRKTPLPDTRFLHFIGTNRHATSLYWRSTRRVIAALA